MDSLAPEVSSAADELLESLALLGQNQPLVGQVVDPKITGSTNKVAIQRVSYTHQDMADFILANPAVAQHQLAARYGYSVAWVSTVINSDAFQVYLASRRAEFVDPTLLMTVEERMRGVTVRSLDVLQEKLSLPVSQISDELALRAATMGSKALGMGIQAPAPPPPSANLNDLADRLVALARRPSNQGVVDVQAREVP